MNRNLRIRHIVRAARADATTTADVRDLLDIIDTFAPDESVFQDLANTPGRSAASHGMLNRLSFELTPDADAIEELREAGPPVAIAPAKEPEWRDMVAGGPLPDPRGAYEDLRRR